jgi:peptidyl-prolyl cis-trans isomerase SurA
LRIAAISLVLLALGSVGEARAQAPVSAKAVEGAMKPVEGAAKAVGEVDRIVASVGTEAITLSEVRSRSKSARNPVAEAVAGEPTGIGDSLKAALDDLVAERLVLAEARKLGLEASDADVDKHIAGIREQNSWSEDDFASAVKMLGFGDAKGYREHARRELLKSQVLRAKVGSKVRITDREVDEEFVRRHPDNTDEEVHLWHIALLVPEQATVDQVDALARKAKVVHASAAAGTKSFEDLAKEFGMDGSAARGGDVGWFTRGKLQASLENMAFSLRDNEISSVVQSSVGFHVLRVTERRRVPLVDADEAKRRVKFEMSEAAFARLYVEYVKELKASGRVIMRPL